jgi:MoaA/NifB/PqqE/SkfB family radical SAM enzyme
VYFARLFLLVTQACDSRCVLCDYWLIKRPRVLEMGLVESKVVPFIRNNRIQVVCISGGEPTLHPELPAIVAAVRRAGATATLTTSTTNLGVHYDRLRDFVTHYMISLDGADRETYLRSRGIDLFDDVVGWVRRLRAETTAEVAISCVLQACNIAQVRPLYELCLQIGAQRLFLRVPDLKPGAFGRSGAVRPKTLRQATVTQADVDGLRADLAWLVKTDARHRLLGQSAFMLERKARFFECLAQGIAYEEDDQRCDVPLTSLVLEPDGNCRPCFYLPQTQAFDDSPASGPAFEDVYERMLNDEGFRREQCNACQQFDGHKHPIGGRAG